MPDYVAPPPPKEALAYFKAKKLKTGFNYRDVWREEHATAFTVAKAMKLDVLTTIRDALEQSLAEGKTFQQFQKELKPQLEKLGWWGQKDMVDPLTGKERLVQLGSPRRLEVIYKTNMRMARAAGQWSRIQRTKKLRPYLLYQLGPSKEHRLEHAGWKGLVLPVDDPFWQTHFPPNGWGCKCFVRHISNAEAEQLGGASESPEIETGEWINKRTGEVSQVSKGIDPGFDYNPGQSARDQHATQVLGTKLMRAPAKLGAQQMASAAEFVQLNMAKNYQNWVRPLYARQRHAVGELQLVGVIKPAVIDALNARNVGLQSAAIVLQDKQVRHLARPKKHERHQALPEAAVVGLADRLNQPKAILFDRDDGTLLYVFDLPEGRLAKVVIALTRTERVRLEGKRAEIRSNDIRTATIVDVTNLPASRYELLDGSL
jgi:hypothetical protein